MRRSSSSSASGLLSICHALAGRRLVDQVDRLVGQEAVGDVAVAERRRGDDRAVGDAHAVMQLVALLQAAQDRDRVLDRGLATNTGWKRRASAASFSMCLRYSSSVVAPTQCSSPRASAGFSMLEASIAPSALPAPTRVCSSSMNRMMSPSAVLHLLAARPSAAPRTRRGTWRRPPGRRDRATAACPSRSARARRR